MGHKKLIRFAELKTFPNVLEFPEGMAGNWHAFFKNNNPITLELACGKGEYAVGLGQRYPQRNFIGVDQKGNRIWAGAKKALDQNLGNVAFLRTQIDHITRYFAPGETSEIWITFPDPQLRASKAKKRLTHPKFLRLYQQFLSPGGFIHLKTDSPDLYRFTKLVTRLYGCSVHRDSSNVYAETDMSEELKIKTYYESLDIAGSRRVHYLCFSLPAEIPGLEKDEELKQMLKAQEDPKDSFGELKEGTHYYISEDGLVVFTERYHLEKGYCCGNGCRHCPFDFENVPEPRKTELKAEKSGHDK